MWLLFVPLALVIAFVLAIGLLVVGVASLLGAAWPVLLILLGIWMFMRDGKRARRANAWRHGTVEATVIRDWPRNKRHQRSAESATPAASDKPAAAASAPSKSSRLPADVEAKAEQVRRKAEALAAQSDRFPPFSQDLYLVRQTANDYLPRTLETYTSMPPESVDLPMVNGGKTPHQELNAQLDLLNSKLDEIAHELERQSNERLMANRKFLQDRFELRNQPDGGALKVESA
jgi:hypothetical protein